MDLDSLHIQIFVSLVLVLGAVFVALVCDFLKGNNEVLREHTIELTVRQEERQKYSSGPPAPATPTEGQEGVIAPPVVETKIPPQAAIPTPTPIWAATLEAPPAPARSNAPPSEVADSKPKRAQALPNSKVTSIDLLERSRPPDPPPAQEIEIAAGSEEPAHPPASPVDNLVLPDDQPLNAIPEAAEISPQTADDPEDLLVLPRGIQDQGALEDALQSTTPFRGTVIAIGFCGKPRPANGGSQDPQEIRQAVEKLIESLLEDGDTAFRAAGDEYLLVLPYEHGPQSQRRRQHVSESLWDYQIRSVGVSSILFYSGSSEAERELFSAVVSRAKEHMYQTKRSRERPPAEIHHYRMNVVRS